jgi:hypothetical protein
MSTQTVAPGTAVESSTVGPGESKTFVYVGEQIPNQVLVQNLSTSEQANFVTEAVNGTDPQWKLFGVLDPGQTIQLWVQWPLEARFHNQGLFQTSFVVYGDGIFPKGGV